MRTWKCLKVELLQYVPTSSICTIFSFPMESLCFWGLHLHIHEHNFFGNAHPSHYTLLLFSKLYCNQMARQARNLGLFVSQDKRKIHVPFVTRIIMVENLVLGLIILSFHILSKSVYQGYNILNPLSPTSCDQVVQWPIALIVFQYQNMASKRVAILPNFWGDNNYL